MGTTRTALFVRKSVGGMFAIEDMSRGTGARFFVHYGTGTDDSGHGFSPDKPFKTLDYAVGKCTANKGDVIYLMPGHAESLAGATGAVLDIAGIDVVGLGRGSLTPTFTLGTATAATISVTAANVRIANIWLTSNLADVAAGITLANTADGAIIEDCRFYDTAVDKELKIAISVAAACDNILIQRCRFQSWTAAATGATTEAISFAGESANSRVIDNIIFGHYVDACIDASTAASNGILLRGNVAVNIDGDAGLAYKGHAASVNILAYNAWGGTKNNTEPVTGVNASYCLENYGIDAVAANALLSPAVGAFA